MRSPRDAREMRGRRKSLSNRGRVTVAVVLAALAVLVLSLRGIARFYTDFLWFDSLNLTSVWSRLLVSKVALGVIFTLVFFVVLLVNLIVADRLAPRFRPSGPEEELLERYFEVVGRRGGAVRVGVALLFAIITGAGVSQQWNNWLLFVNGGSFGATDPQFGQDIGFYVFKLPFLVFVANWLFTAFVIVLIVTAVAHYLNGGIRVQTPAQRVTAQVKAHLSLLLAALALTKAAGYWLSRFELTSSTRGFVNGATYTDVKAQLPAINLLLLISLFSTVLFIYNIWRRGWVLPVSAVGLWAFLAILAGQAYPWFVQRFQVEPAESTREQPYIDRNVAATRIAYGLDAVTVREFTGKGEIGPVELASPAGQNTLANARLLDPDIVGEAFQKNQTDLGWVKLGELDVDRYEIDGKTTPVLLAARELVPTQLPTKSWEAERLIYTHGYGVVMAPANEVENRVPGYVVQSTPIQIDEERLEVELDPKQARLYFTENLPGYSFVNTGREETGYRDDKFHYDGSGGVRLNSSLRRVAFALRFWNINPVISSYITDQSRAQYVRGITDRVAAVAPFLSLDSDPYPVLTDSGVSFVLDAYTTTDRYPYSESKNGLQTKFGVVDLPSKSGLAHNFNYVRNSVKAVVDAYDGSVQLYVVDQPDGRPDPIIEAYRKAFPKLFKPVAEMPADLQAHLRHPEDLFRVQTSAYGPYRVDAPNFYGQTQRWVVSQQPATDTRARTTPTTSPASAQPGTAGLGQRAPVRNDEQRMLPQYLQIQMPGEAESEFVLLRSFVPVSENDEQRKLTGFMIAKPGGELVAYSVPGAELPGPTLISANIDANAEVSQKVSLLDQRGSAVKFGNLLLLPINDSLLWVRPLYVTAEGSNSVPDLEAVIVVYKERIVQAPTLDEALGILFGKAGSGTGRGVDEPPVTTPPTVPGGGPSVGPSQPGAEGVTQWAKRAQDALEQAESLLRGGDLGGYKAKVDEAKTLIQKIAEATSPVTPEQTGKA